jgi:hypothetical protein
MLMPGNMQASKPTQVFRPKVIGPEASRICWGDECAVNVLIAVFGLDRLPEPTL